MNNRIRELVEQAILDVDIVYEDNILNEELAKMYIPNCFAEQFAKLIIKECIDLCDEIEDDYLKEFGDMDVAIGAEACSYKISAHFGVE